MTKSKLVVGKMVKASTAPQHAGVYVRKDRNGILSYHVVYQVNGQQTWEQIGKDIEGMTVAKAAKERTKLIQQAEFMQSNVKPITLDDMFLVYISMMKTEGKRTWTHEMSRYTHVQPVLGKKRMDRITKKDASKLKECLVAKGLAMPTIGNIFSLINRLYLYGKDNGYYEGVSPIVRKSLRLTNSVTKIKRKQWLSMEQGIALLTELRLISENEYRIANISLHSGMRMNEVMSLTPNKVDTLTWMFVNIPTKHKSDPNKTRTIPVDRNLKPMLRKMLHEMKGFDSNKKFFQSFSYINYYKAVNKLGFNNGVTSTADRIVFHSLRHTFASHQLDQGTNQAVLMDIMGHETLQALQIYLHTNQEAKVIAMNRMADAWEEVTKKLRDKAIGANLRIIHGGKKYDD